MSCYDVLITLVLQLPQFLVSGLAVSTPVTQNAEIYPDPDQVPESVRIISIPPSVLPSN